MKSCPQPILHRIAPSENRNFVTLERGSDLRAKAINFAKVDGATQGVLQQKTSLLQPNQRESTPVLDFHRKVDVAVRSIVTTGDGSKYGEMTDTASAKLRLLFRKLRLYGLESKRHQDLAR
jgi:hypothetical protein